jgi:DNA-binding transcriptional MerR regulator
MVGISSGPAAPGAIVGPGVPALHHEQLLAYHGVAAAPTTQERCGDSSDHPLARLFSILKGVVVQEKNGSADSNPNDKFDDEDYSAYSMGSAAQILGTTPGFLRSLDEAKLLTPQRSEGGHRRYSRYQLRIAARARELVDRGTALDAACRIIILEDQLAEAHAINAELHRSLDARRAPSSADAQSLNDALGSSAETGSG